MFDGKVWRAWSHLHFAVSAWVYPKPELVPPPLPMRGVGSGDGYALEVDLEGLEVRDTHGLKEPFSMDAASRQRLLEGKDEIDLILAHEPDIAAFERRTHL